MAENRESYIAGGNDAAPAHNESTMRDMDRMLDDTLAGTSTTRNADIDVEYTGSGAAGTGTADPDATRAEIEQTRARMSETIDEIEDALLRKKENIQDRLNVFGPVKQNPLPSVGIVFGAGLLLGYLTGEDDDDDDQVHHRHVSTEDDEFWARRASDWEARARRLLDLAKRQEVELSELRGRHEMTTAATAGAAATGAAGAPSGAAWRSSPTGAGTSRDTYSADAYEVTLEDSSEDISERLNSPLRKVGDTVVEGLTSFLARTTRELSGTQQR